MYAMLCGYPPFCGGLGSSRGASARGKRYPGNAGTRAPLHENTCTHAHMHARTHACTHACVHARMQTCNHTCTYLPYLPTLSAYLTYYISHPASCIPHTTHDIPHTTYRIPHATCHMPHTTHHIPHTTYRIPHTTYQTVVDIPRHGDTHTHTYRHRRIQT